MEGLPATSRHRDIDATKQEAGPAMNEPNNATNPSAPSAPRSRRHVIASLKVVTPALICMVLLLAAGIWLLPPALEAILLRQQQKHLEAMTSIAADVVDVYVEQEHAGGLTRAQAQRLAAEHLREIRYGGDETGYYWINDLFPRIVMHPYRPDIEGRDVSDEEDPNGKLLFVEMATLARRQGEGFVDYFWQWLDDSTRLEHKVSHVRLVPEWGWVVGTGAYLEDERAAFADMTRGLLAVWGGLVVGVLLLYMYILRQRQQAETRRRETARHLEHERDLNARLIENSPAIVLLLEPGGTVTLANKTAARLLPAVAPVSPGPKSDQRLALPQGQASLASTFGPRDREHFTRACERAARRRHPVKLQTWIGTETSFEESPSLRSRHGRLIEWRLRRIPRPGSADNHILAIGLDVTTRYRAIRRMKAYHQRLRRLASHLMSVEDRQRRHIAADLHDQVGQNLAAARFNLTELESRCYSPDHQAVLRDTRDLIKQTMRETSSLQFELSPPMLYEFGLGRAIEWYLDEVGARHEIRTKFIEHGSVPELPEGLRGMLFQAARELVRNAVRHACASWILVTLHVRGSHLILVVRDDGCGFDPKASLQARGTPGTDFGGFGLFGLKERLRTIQSRLDVMSAPGHGTTARIVLPLPTDDSQQIQALGGHEARHKEYEHGHSRPAGRRPPGLAARPTGSDREAA